MDIFALAAKLTLDSSEYERGIEAAKNAANSFGQGLSAVVSAVTNTDQAVNSAADSAENLSESTAEAARGTSELVNAERNTANAVQAASDSMSDAADSAEDLSRAADQAADGVEAVEDSTSDASQKMSVFDKAIRAIAGGVDGLTTAGENVKKGFNTIHGAVDAVKSKFQSLTDAGKSLVDGGLNKVQTGVENVRNKFAPLSSAAQRLVGVFAKTSDAAEENADSMDESAKSSETLKNRIAMLQGVYDAAKAKVARLTDEFNKSAEETGATSDETKALAKELDRAEREVNDAEKALKQYANRADDAEKETRQLGDAQDDTSNKTSRFGDIVKGVLTANAIKAGLSALWSGVKRIGQAFISVGKQAVEAYGNYEQLVGGVETLLGAKGANSVEEYAKIVGKSVKAVKKEYKALKDSESTVLKNATNAYKTAGMSANQYMETVTSFSASLLQGLGGNTKKAAKLADVAVRDMSDNANKMGTDMQSIQNAYQGFAKQNYTMLDNLKLGYGGTKEEMKRLLKDANALNAAQGKHTKYSIENYADIISAIHDVQVNMGIYGTTANEAQSTIQGSLNMTKAAWENLLVAVADEDADFDGAIDNLIESATAAGENLIPRVEQIIKGIGRAIEKLLPIALEEIPKAISRYAPEVLTALGSLVSIIYTSFNDLLTNTDWSGLGASLANKINEIDWVTLFHDVGETIMNGLRAALDFTTGFLESIDWEKLGEDIVNSLTEFGQTIDWGAIVSSLFELLGAAIGGAKALLDGVAQALWDNFKAALEATWDYFGQYIDEAGGNVIEGLFNGIINAMSSIGSWIYNNIFKPFIDGFKNAFGIHSPSTVMAQMGKFIIDGLVNGIKDMPAKVWSFLVQTVQKAIQFGADMKNKAVETAKMFVTNLVNGFTSLPGKMASIGANVIKGLWQGISDFKGWIIGRIKSLGTDVVDTIKHALGINSPSKYTRANGRSLIEGLVMGIEDDENKATKAASKLSDSVIKAFNSDGLAMSMEGLPDLNADISSQFAVDANREENQTIAILNTILNAIYAIDEGMYSKIQSALDGTDIRWNDRELGRFVKTYA